MKTPGLLILAVGNPSRGDDALGPLLLERLAGLREQGGGWDDIELLTDFQLQIEHAVDLEGRKLVLFVDASVSCPPPCQFTRLQPARDSSYTSHALTPAAVLHVYEQINSSPPPPAFLLAIRGESFELGESLSPAAKANLMAALEFVGRLLAHQEVGEWDESWADKPVWH
ncbi:MAG: hydrogenase maturation protease [Candidatus Competibacteraceae bacterium]|nr:hydrogenase maturation protease [Candidatus Competibacteraceae bacterium]MBK7983304.1 hydrogenase maturation protease [Candidatus Competibacteraceae bacterium]MBK8898150.1 hydrogenase maturation protease [Candidatus Competibacteraceae bacterium]MBK8961956.1 hydrogenase maturation protease [Candidatus Competibacteraceae bacterium]MBK9951172.1 hydrogenase maturation protease [Candidatus Competibacteraceae bacterium]